MNHVDHSKMDHSAHNMAGHEGHVMPGTCKTSMLFTWDYQDACVVFEWWHIYNTTQLVISMIVIAGLTYGYEWFKSYTARQVRRRGENAKLYRSCAYGVQVFISFMIMLIFMSFNGWLMIAVVAGAIAGNYVYSDADGLPLSCH